MKNLAIAMADPFGDDVIDFKLEDADHYFLWRKGYLTASMWLEKRSAKSKEKKKKVAKEVAKELRKEAASNVAPAPARPQPPPPAVGYPVAVATDDPVEALRSQLGGAHATSARLQEELRASEGELSELTEGYNLVWDELQQQRAAMAAARAQCDALQAQVDRAREAGAIGLTPRSARSVR